MTICCEQVMREEWAVREGDVLRHCHDRVLFECVPQNVALCALDGQFECHSQNVALCALDDYRFAVNA